MTLITEVLCSGSPFGCTRRPNTRNDCLRNEDLSSARMCYLRHHPSGHPTDSLARSAVDSDPSDSGRESETCFGRLTAFVGRTDNKSTVPSDSMNSQTISEHLRKICAKSLTKPDVVLSDCHSSLQLSPAMDSTHLQTNNNNNYAVTQSNGVVCEGWLTKSPPEKIWKTKWRRRWFVLRLSGQIPGQYVLEYYADPSKRKLKGVIDLDQCEQVDAGLQLESRKENFQFMFDVKTTKRIFYLVAKSEPEMNKWVECICSVCGLKMHVEEGQDDRYSPQPSGQEFVSANNSANSTLASTTSLTSNSKTASTATITSVPTSSSTLSTTTSNNTLTKNKKFVSLDNSLNNSITKTNNSKNTITKNDAKTISRSDSKTSTNGRVSVDPRPYIPISECHTGRPITGSLSEMDYVPAVPSKTGFVASDECYDVPLSVNPAQRLHANPHTEPNDTENLDNVLNFVPKAPKSASHHNQNSCKPVRGSDSVVANPPKVNWSTYPRDSPDPSHDVTKHSVNDSGIENQRSSSPLNSDLNRDSVHSSDGNAQPPLGIAPPRPPKPPSLRKSKKQSETCASLPNVSQLYDVPPTAVEQNLKNDDHSPTGRHAIHSHSDGSPKSPDQLYDFPVMNRVSESVQLIDTVDKDIINATVPVTLDRASLRSNKKHSYTNAPPGYFTNKETVFNYEYRPTLSSGAEDTNAFLTNIDSQADRSPLTPNSATYNNLPISSSLPNSLTVGPPAVNRDLKPRRKGSDSDSNPALPSPTMKSATIQLQPPPALTRIHSAPTKRSFRKPGNSSQPHMTISGTPPRIPSRVPGHYHNREPSTSEDDNGNVSHNANVSRRNSSNDEPTQSKGTVVPPPRRPNDGSEIQYLDLDLDSDTQSQSPRTPNEHIHQRSGSTLSNKELSTNNSQAPLSSGSTVYKTVDFLRTEAFNKTRLNLENYRNSQ